MSFKPFDFTFTPPLTVPAPTTSTPIETAASGASNQTSSRVATLVTQLDELTVMSQYLQDAIVARTRQTAIEIDGTIDPATSRALSGIYGTDSPPTLITIPMYDQLLDAHLGALQLEMSVGTDSTIEANPIQVGDLMTAISTLDSHLIASATYKTWLPLQLASLKGDSVLFQAWKASLQTYPAYYAQPLVVSEFRPSTIQAASLDISHDLYEYESGVVTHFGRSYSTLYQGMAGVTSVERDVNSILIQYFYQPLQNILRIVALFNALKGFVHKTSMEDLTGDLVNYSFVRLASEVTSMLHTCDQLVAMAVAPLRGTLGSLGRIVAGVQAQAAVAGFLLGGGLTGLSKANACAQGNPYNKIKGGEPLNIPGLGEISEGLKYLGEKLSWAGNMAEHGLGQVDKSFRQLLERRMMAQDDRNQLMCSIRALDVLMGTAKGVAGEYQQGNVTPNSNPQQIQEASARILTSLQTESDTTFVSDSGDIIVNPPDMPAAPKAVRNVLSRSKIRTTKGVLEA